MKIYIKRWRAYFQIYPVLYFLFLISCQLEKTESVLHLSNANWLGTGMDTIKADSIRYKVDPAPLFRKEFNTSSGVRSAYVLITAAGYYQATLNGKKIGKNYFDPAWTDYNNRIYYTIYDVTDHIEVNNCIGVTLGNGFYNSLPMKMWGNLNLRDYVPTGKPVFKAKIVLKYENGTTEVIVSDLSWKFGQGPIQKNNVYLGEVYDASKEIKDWDKPGFDDRGWNPVNIMKGPSGVLKKAFFPPIQITEVIKPISIRPALQKQTIIDMGVNFTGIYRIKLKGHAHDTITIRVGERIYKDGTLNPMTTVAGQIKHKGKGGEGSPAIAWQSDTFIFGKDSVQWYSPLFTYHTFRYMEVSGMEYPLGKEDVQGLATNSNVKESGAFSCSSVLVNSIQDATKRTFKANLIGVQSDCAAREKFGYGGDLNATNEAFMYNFQMEDFYVKTVYDWLDAMQDSTFVDTAPYVGLKYCGISWESAFLITQYNIYKFYGNKNLIKKLYPINLKWMDKVSKIHPRNIVDKGLSDHESLEPVPVELTGTAHYYQCAKIMQEFASLMGDQKSEHKFSKLADRIKAILLSQFWEKKPDPSINNQTVYATLLYLDIIPESEVRKARDLLITALKNSSQSHFTTGIFGTKYILETLSKLGHVDLVFDIVNSTEYPGWGYMISQGATTIWETWKESDNVYSNCHPMFGSVSEWFYRWLGGIRPIAQQPGFKEFILNPHVPKNLDFVKTSYISPQGEIISNWNKIGEGHVIYNISIPKGSKAWVDIGNDPVKKISIEKFSTEDFIPINGNSFQKEIFELTEGKYRIEAQTLRQN